MSELDMIFEQLRTIAADIATMQEALGLLVEALHPPPTAPVVEAPAIATYTQMYGQVETPKEAVQPGVITLFPNLILKPDRVKSDKSSDCQFSRTLVLLWN